MIKIALSAGHGLNTLGNRCLKTLDRNETREWQLNARVCQRVETMLKEYTGYELIRTDDISGQKDITLLSRVSKANKFKADIYISVHHNAGIRGGNGGGIMAFTYTKVDDATKSWQKDLYDALIKYTSLSGNRSNPLSSANFYELRATSMPAVLLELGFMDSKTDTPIILTDTFADNCAKAIVEVIVKKGNLQRNTEEKPIFTGKSIDELAREVIKGLWGNGSERKKKLAQAGYDYSAIQARVNQLLK